MEKKMKAQKFTILMIAGVLAVCMSMILATTSIAAETYDLVILNGRVMDPETMFDAVRNVGIKDGKIVTITKDKIQGKESINVKGHVVAPGFIDTHLHGTSVMAYKLVLRDGVTSSMDLEEGALGSYMDQWYKDREGKTQLNFGVASSHELARSLVLDGAMGKDTLGALKTRAAGNNWSQKKVTLEEGNKILQVIDEGLRAGGIGIGSTLGYMRDGVTAREMFEVQKLGAKYGRQTGIHFRNTPGSATGEVNGVQEQLANAAALGAPALACHFNNPGWGLVHELLARYRDRGMNVWGEIYPYAAGGTALNAVFLKPEVWLDQLGHKYEDTLMDPLTNKFFTRATYEEMVKKDPTRIVIVYKMPKEDIVKWLQMPGVTIGSDAMPVSSDISWDTPYEELPNNHPRTSGAHAKTLRMGRENSIPIMQSLSQLSYNSAKYLGKTGLKSMQIRGRMQEGMVADITIFDPENVTDNATYKNGMVPSTGIPYVIVNGTIVVKNSKVLKGVNPGQPIRFTPIEESLFEELKVDSWTKAYMVAPIEFGGTIPSGQHE